MKRNHSPLRLPPPFEYTQIVRTPTLEKTVRLNDFQTVLIYSRPPMCGDARFFYTVERKREDGGVQMSNSYDGFYSVEQAEHDARRFAMKNPQPAKVLAPTHPPSPVRAHPELHYHYCLHCDVGVMDCINPECWKHKEHRLVFPIECPKCDGLTNSYSRFTWQGKVSRFIPLQLEAVAAD